MNTLKQILFGVLAVAVFAVPASASAASASVANLSSATPLAKTSVTFTMSVTGFTIPIYQMTDSFPGTSINSGNMNFGGNFQWVPNVSDIGTHNITIAVTDSSGNSSTATQTITVLPPPSITIQSVSPGSTVQPGAPFTFSVTSPGFTNPTFSVGDSFSGSTANYNTINSSGNFSWTPNASQNGDHAITIYASDTLGHTAQATVSVRVGSGPTLSVPSNLTTTISPGQQINFSVTPAGFIPTGFSVYDKFPGVSTISNGNISASGLFMWSPSGSDAGTHTVTITGQVGAYGQSASTTVTINVLGQNGLLPPAPVSATAATTSNSGVSALQAQLAALQAQLGTGAAPASASNSYIFTSYLKQGSESDEVMELQKVLSKLGFLSVVPNGYFGPSTLAAVKKFQAAHGLDQLGAVGPGTRLALNSLAGTAPSAPALSSVSNSTYVFEHFMGVGDDDPDVLELQKRLVLLGFLKAEPTGYYGTGTEAAVKKFQSKHGLPQTGYVAKNTRAVLNTQ